MTEKQIDKLRKLYLLYCRNCKTIVQHNGLFRSLLNAYLLDGVIDNCMNCCKKPNYIYLRNESKLLNYFNVCLDLGL